MAKKKVLIIYTGGTFGMIPEGKGSFSVSKLTPHELKLWLFQQVPEIQELAQIEVQILFNQDSAEFQPENWLKLCATLQKVSSKFQGVVVLHGTDTLAYGAAFASMLLTPTPCPIVFTGAQRPLSTLRNDARSNLIDAIEVALKAPDELQNRVLAVFHHHVFLGSRIQKKSATELDAFHSPRFPSIGKIGARLEWTTQKLPKTRTQPLIQSILKQNRLLTPAPVVRILTLPMTPDFWLGQLSPSLRTLLFNEIHALIITLYPSGTAPLSQIQTSQFFDFVSKTSVPVIGLTTGTGQAPAPDTYPSGRALQKKRAIFAGDHTLEATWVKTWILMSLMSVSKKQFTREFKKALSDEL